jgi:hypothetical protein
MAKNTKTATVIAIMTKHQDKDMAAVSKLIESNLPCKEGYGKVWYRWAVNNGKAPGSVEATKRGPKAVAKAPKVAKTSKNSPKTSPKPEKAKKAAVPEKSADEIAKIKAANLQKMKAVSAKIKKYNQVAAPDGPGVPNFNRDKARAEVAEMLGDQLPSWSVPESLSADEVRALV